MPVAPVTTHVLCSEKSGATSSGAGTVRVYALPVDRLLAPAQSRLARTWTNDECRAYLPGGRCPAVAPVTDR
jgi:hypothetical protein